MSDVCDDAKIAEEMFRRAAFSARPVTASGRGRVDCIDCGEEIPAERRDAMQGAERCVFCQGQFEGRR